MSAHSKALVILGCDFKAVLGDTTPGVSVNLTEVWLPGDWVVNNIYRASTQLPWRSEVPVPLREEVGRTEDRGAENGPSPKAGAPGRQFHLSEGKLQNANRRTRSGAAVKRQGSLKPCVMVEMDGTEG